MSYVSKLRDILLTKEKFCFILHLTFTHFFKMVKKDWLKVDNNSLVFSKRLNLV